MKMTPAKLLTESGKAFFTEQVQPRMSLSTEPNPSARLNGRFRSGLYWAAFGRVLQLAIQLSFTAALSWMLSPGDYGMMAMVAVFTGFATMLADGGFNSALVQRRETTEIHTQTVFWINLGASVLAAVTTCLIAPYLARFFLAPTLTLIFRIISINFVLGALGGAPGAMLEKRMQFKAIALNLNLALIVSGVLGVTCAFLGAGVWSLVAQSLAFSATNSLMRCWSCRWRPRWVFDLRVMRDLLGFSGHFYVYNSINYWGRNADNLLVGKFFGAAILGSYSRAYSLMLLPMSQINSVVAQVVFPGFSGIQDDRNRIKSIYLKAIGVVSLLTFPMMMGLEVAAAPFVSTLYGEKWSDVVLFIKILAPVGMLQSVANTVGWIYLPLGKTKLMLYTSAIVVIGEIIAFWIGIEIGSAKALAVSYALFYLICFYPFVAIAWRTLDIRPSEVFPILAGPFFSSLAMGAVVFGLGTLIPAAWSPWEALLALVGSGVVFYVGVVRLFRLSAANTLLALVVSKAGPDDDAPLR
jgi:PST family polysaccharide transporter